MNHYHLSSEGWDAANGERPEYYDTVVEKRPGKRVDPSLKQKKKKKDLVKKKSRFTL